MEKNQLNLMKIILYILVLIQVSLTAYAQLYVPATSIKQYKIQAITEVRVWGVDTTWRQNKYNREGKIVEENTLPKRVKGQKSAMQKNKYIYENGKLVRTDQYSDTLLLGSVSYHFSVKFKYNQLLDTTQRHEWIRISIDTAYYIKQKMTRVTTTETDLTGYTKAVYENGVLNEKQTRKKYKVNDSTEAIGELWAYGPLGRHYKQDSTVEVKGKDYTRSISWNDGIKRRELKRLFKDSACYYELRKTYQNKGDCWVSEAWYDWKGKEMKRIDNGKVFTYEGGEINCVSWCFERKNTYLSGKLYESESITFTPLMLHESRSVYDKKNKLIENTEWKYEFWE